MSNSYLSILNIPEYLKATYSDGSGFEQDLHFEDMYIDSKGNVGSKEDLELFAREKELICPKCSSKQIEVHETIDGYHHCSCIDCGEIFQKIQKKEVL